ncbi:hypothetical protein F5148DRAFT_1239532, partial [Russula earlei]
FSVPVPWRFRRDSRTMPPQSMEVMSCGAVCIVPGRGVSVFLIFVLIEGHHVHRPSVKMSIRKLTMCIPLTGGGFWMVVTLPMMDFGKFSNSYF